MELEIFKNNGYKIRGFMVNNEPYFVAKDIAESLGYDSANVGKKNYDPTGNMIEIVDNDDVFTQKELPDLKRDVQDLGLHPSLKLINESGMYAAIFGSRLSKAKEFKKWVTSEVLPSIRKTGGYGTPKRLTTDELLELTQTRLIEIKKQKEKAVKMMETAKMIEFNNTNQDDTISMAEFAHILSDRFGVIVGRNIIYVILREMGLVMQSSTQPSQRGMLVYLAYRKHDHGYSTRVFADKANQLSKYIIKFLSNNEMFNDAIGNPFQI